MSPPRYGAKLEDTDQLSGPRCFPGCVGPPGAPVPFVQGSLAEHPPQGGARTPRVRKFPSPAAALARGCTGSVSQEPGSLQGARNACQAIPPAPSRLFVAAVTTRSFSPPFFLLCLIFCALSCYCIHIFCRGKMAFQFKAAGIR